MSLYINEAAEKHIEKINKKKKPNKNRVVYASCKEE